MNERDREFVIINMTVHQTLYFTLTFDSHNVKSKLIRYYLRSHFRDEETESHVLKGTEQGTESDSKQFDYKRPDALNSSQPPLSYRFFLPT